jgi:hypothetical protein
MKLRLIVKESVADSGGRFAQTRFHTADIDVFSTPELSLLNDSSCDVVGAEVIKGDSPIQCTRELHHNGGIYRCQLPADHVPDGHLFELPDVDTVLPSRKT